MLEMRPGRVKIPSGRIFILRTEDKMTEEHPFAQYVRIIGKGPHLSRPLTREETQDAVRMIMQGEVEPIQLGAFLCLLRVRTEVPEEAAGFIDAVRETLEAPEGVKVDLDWPSYAGKKRQLPWFILSALLLASNGIKVFMHGAEGHTPGRIYARDVMKLFNIEEAKTFSEAAEQMEARNFAFMPLEYLSPHLNEIMALKSVLGLRSPVNTFARMLNPFKAPCEIQGIFHPNYKDVHRGGGKLLGQPHIAVLKGEGGEAERRPAKPAQVQWLNEGKISEEEWPPMIDEADAAHDQEMNPDHLAALWTGTMDSIYGEAAVVGTAAVALKLLGKVETIDVAQALAATMWAERDKGLLA